MKPLSLVLIMMAAACAPDAVTAPTPVAEALPARALPTLPEMRLRDVLGGRAPGIRVTSATERARGARIRIVIREGSPIRPENQPLFVLDGIPLSQGGLEAAAVNPNEILDIQIVKGPAAVRIYGYRARNGAVLIRTRRR
jgi:outer membrane receptor protein involved in Fe transport